jgi:hypothetical protein
VGTMENIHVDGTSLRRTVDVLLVQGLDKAGSMDGKQIPIWTSSAGSGTGCSRPNSRCCIILPRLFFGLLVALVHTSVPNIHTALIACRADIAAVCVTQYKVWPVVDWINFTYVPEPLQVLFCSLVTLLWNVYMSGTVAGAAR